MFKRTIKLLTLVVMMFVGSSAKTQGLDTIYYDKDWKGVSNKAFATFYRVIESENSDPNIKRHYRDYYITGELQSEGSCISIDRFDDSKSVFDGEFIAYYKSGNIEQKGYYSNGKQEKDYTAYYENGLIKLHVNMKNGKPDGILTEFSEDGSICTQMEMQNGEPKYDYFVVSNKDGYSSKIRISDNTPIWESPKINEKKTEYKDGVTWPYYVKNGLLVASTNTEVKDYGKWYKITIIIANNSMFPIDFDPGNIRASLLKSDGEITDLEVWSSEEYMRKVRRTQNWNAVAMGITEGLNAVNAGYSSSTTTTNSSYRGGSNSYGNASVYGSNGQSAYGTYSGSSSYYGTSSSKSTTTNYDGYAAYQAQIIASDRIANYENALLQERAIKQEGYLKKTTIYPGETISGYINIKRKKGDAMSYIIDINGAKYEFIWNVSK